MLSFEVIPAGISTAVQICLDEAGLAVLLARIDDAKRQGHVHLCTPDNGGKELDNHSPLGNPAVGEVIIDWVGG